MTSRSYCFLGLCWALLFLPGIGLGEETRLRVAFVGFSFADQPGNPGAANLTAAVHALISSQNEYDWVDREELDRAFDEISLGLSGIVAEMTAIRAGHMVRADMLVRGSFLRLADDKVALNLSVIDPRRADLLGMVAVDLDLDSAGRLVLAGNAIKRVTDVLDIALENAAARLREVSGRRVIAPLFFRNVGPLSRLDFVEERLKAAIARQAASSSDLHVLQFPEATEAEGEAELVLMGLAEEDGLAWRKVADVYVWGEYTELETAAAEVPFAEVPFRITLTLWDGETEPVLIEREGLVGNLQRTIEEMSTEVVARSGDGEDDQAPLGAERPIIAATLRDRADAVQAQIGRSGGKLFLQVPEGHRLYAYHLKLLETACFFDPLDRDLRQERLTRAWAPENPSEPLATLGGHWRRVEQYFIHLDRFPLSRDGAPNLELREQLVEVLYEAALAVHRGKNHNLSPMTAHEQKREIAQLIVREIHAINAAASDGQEEYRTDLNGRLFKSLFLGKGGFSPFWQNPEFLYLFAEELWPYFRPAYVEMRNRGTDNPTWREIAGTILSAYKPFGLRHRAIAMLSDGYTGEGTTATPDPAKAAPKNNRASIPDQTTSRSPWKSPELIRDTAEGFPFPPHVPLVAKEIAVWPKVYYGGNGFPPARLAFSTWHFLKWHEGVLWMSQSAKVSLPSEDGWRNEAGSHYFWAYDPVSGGIRNLTRKLPPHVTINDTVFQGDDIWLSVKMDGVWRWNPAEEKVTRFGVSDGMVNHDVRSGVLVGDSIFFGGRSSGPAALSRYSIENDTWFAVERDPSLDDRTALVTQIVRFQDWLLLIGREPELYNVRTGEWRSLPLHRAEQGRFLAAATEDGFWIARGQSLVRVDPRSPGAPRPASTYRLPGTATALALQGDVLWIGIEREQVFQVSAKGTRTNSSAALFGLDVERAEWIAEVPVKEDSIDHIATSPDHVWFAGGRVWEMDTHLLDVRRPETKEPSHWRSKLFGEDHPLHAAVWNDNATQLRSLLDEGFDPDKRCEQRRTPLLLAVLRGDTKMIEMLLANGANPDLVARDGDFPLLAAVDAGDVDAVKKLLAHGADVNNQGPPARYKFSGHLGSLHPRDPHIHSETPPDPPIDVQAEALSSTAVRLTWEAGSGNESRWIISAPYHTVYLNGTARSYTDILTPVARKLDPVSYIIRAINGANAGNDESGAGRTQAETRVSVHLPPPEDDPAHAYYPKEQQPSNWTNPTHPRERFSSRKSALMAAAESGRSDIADLLIQAGAELDATDVFGDTALLYAVRNANPETALLLLDRGADINARNENGTTALGFVYARREDLALFKELLKRGADPNIAGYPTLLMQAARAGRIDDVEFLLSHGADMHATTSSGDTALSYAVARGYHELADLFFELGFDPMTPFWSRDEIEHVGDKVLTLAIDQGLDDLLVKLLEAGTDPNAEGFEGMPIHRAARAGNLAAVKSLIEYGANSTHKDRFGQTAFELAKDEEIRRLLAPPGPIEMPLPQGVGSRLIEIGPPLPAGKTERTKEEQILDRRLIEAAAVADRDAVEALLAKGAWIDAPDDTGRTPLIRAIQGGDMAFVFWLLDQGPTLNTVTERGYSPVAFAVDTGNENLVRKLLDRGASPDLRRSVAGTPLQVAIRNDNFSLTRLLLDYGACPKQMGFYYNGFRYNSLMLAAARGQRDTVQLLLDHGASVEAYDFSAVHIGGSDQEIEKRVGPNVVFWAASSNDPWMIDLVLDQGADLWHKSHGGHNALCWAAELGLVETTAHLLDLGLEYLHPLDPPPGNISEEILGLLQP